MQNEREAAEGKSERKGVQCVQENISIVREHAHPQANP